MLKKVAGRKLGRNTNSRKALFRGLVRSLVLEGSIVTTKSKALAVRPLVDRILTKVKSGKLEDRRAVLSLLGNDRETTKLLFTRFTSLAKSRNSGFTKMTNLPRRRGDNVREVRLEWTLPMDEIETPKKEKVEKKTKSKK